MSLRRGVVLALSVGAAACAAVGGEEHDSVPESRDVIVTDAGAQDPQGYAYVARRPLAVVALAEARGLDPSVAKEAIDRLADALDTCATAEGRKGTLGSGAARLVAAIDDLGRVGQPTARVDPGPHVAENAVVCLMTPLKLLTFPPSDAGARGIAIEAIWGQVMTRK